MIGDEADIRKRLRLALPTRWFGDVAPVLDGVLSGFASAWTDLYSLLQFVMAQTRVRTAFGEFLDIAANDFLSTPFRRRLNETDTSFRQRLLRAMGRSHATRPAIVAAAQAAGYTVNIFEAAQPGDTGAYNTPARLAWNTLGAWGSLEMPFESLIIAQAGGDAVESELWQNVADATPAGGAMWLRIAPAA